MKEQLPISNNKKESLKSDERRIEEKQKKQTIESEKTGNDTETGKKSSNEKNDSIRNTENSSEEIDNNTEDIKESSEENEKKEDSEKVEEKSVEDLENELEEIKKEIKKEINKLKKEKEEKDEEIKKLEEEYDKEEDDDKKNEIQNEIDKLKEGIKKIEKKILKEKDKKWNKQFEIYNVIRKDIENLNKELEKITVEEEIEKKKKEKEEIEKKERKIQNSIGIGVLDEKGNKIGEDGRIVYGGVFRKKIKADEKKINENLKGKNFTEILKKYKEDQNHSENKNQNTQKIEIEENNSIDLKEILDLDIDKIKNEIENLKGEEKESYNRSKNFNFKKLNEKIKPEYKSVLKKLDEKYKEILERQKTEYSEEDWKKYKEYQEKKKYLDFIYYQKHTEINKKINQEYFAEKEEEKRKRIKEAEKEIINPEETKSEKKEAEDVEETEEKGKIMKKSLEELKNNTETETYDSKAKDQEEIRKRVEKEVEEAEKKINNNDILEEIWDKNSERKDGRITESKNEKSKTLTNNTEKEKSEKFVDKIINFFRLKKGKNSWFKNIVVAAAILFGAGSMYKQNKTPNIDSIVSTTIKKPELKKTKIEKRKKKFNIDEVEGAILSSDLSFEKKVLGIAGAIQEGDINLKILEKLIKDIAKEDKNLAIKIIEKNIEISERLLKEKNIQFKIKTEDLKSILDKLKTDNNDIGDTDNIDKNPTQPKKDTKETEEKPETQNQEKNNKLTQLEKIIFNSKSNIETITTSIYLSLNNFKNNEDFKKFIIEDIGQKKPQLAIDIIEKFLENEGKNKIQSQNVNLTEGELNLILSELNKIQENKHQNNQIEKHELWEQEAVEFFKKLNQKLGKEKYPTSIEEIKNMTSLNLSGLDLKEIPAFIGKLTNLKKLNLNNTKIINIDVLQYLTSLEKLNLNNTKIINIDVLQYLTSLKELSLGSTDIENIDVLQYLTNLKELDLSNTKIKNINALKNLTNLKWILLSKNQYKESKLKELREKNHNLEIDFPIF